MNSVVNIRKNKYDVYIGRAGHGLNGEFGNPHPIGYCAICKAVHDRDGSILAFQQYFWRKVNSDNDFLKKVLKLKGKILGCFCKPLPCHGDVYTEFLKWTDTEDGKRFIEIRIPS